MPSFPLLTPWKDLRMAQPYWLGLDLTLYIYVELEMRNSDVDLHLCFPLDTWLPCLTTLNWIKSCGPC